jgi:hypothetical protein
MRAGKNWKLWHKRLQDGSSDMKKDNLAENYTLARHGINGIIGYVTYVVTFFLVVKLADLLLGAEEARENLPLYLSFYIGACCLVTTLVILKKVKHDLGITREPGGSFILYAVIGFAVQFFAFHLMSRVGFMPIEILIYFSFIVLVLSALVSYRFFMEMTSGKKKRRPRR